MAELIRAIRSEDEVETWKQLARSDVKTLVNSQSKSKLETPLFWASMKGNVGVVCSLLGKGAKMDLKTNWGATPLHAASEMGHLEVVKLLLANRSQLNHQTQFGDTPAHLAAYRGHFDVVKYLVEAGSDIFLKNSERRTVLDEASVAEHAKIVRYLESIVFGNDMKPTLWKTPYREDDPMVTTNLMQTASASSSYPTSPRRKQPVCRSHSTDQTAKEQTLLNEVRFKLKNLSYEDVIHHPTLLLRPAHASDDVIRHPIGREKQSVDTSRHRASGSLVIDAMHKDKRFITSSPRPHSDIAAGSRRSSAFSPSRVYGENARARSLEKMVTELQCGLSYTQDELSKTKANLKVAKEQIDILCATQKGVQGAGNNNQDISNNERRRLILNIRDK